MPRRRLAAATVVLAVLAALAAACGGGGAAAPGESAATSAGAAAAASGGGSADGPADGAGGLSGLSFVRFDGTQASFADYAGRPLVVNFFASWCAPCVREMPEFERIHQELGDRVAFLGIDVRDRLAEGQKLARQTGVSYDLARDPGGDVLTGVGGALLPTTAFITADGRLAAVKNHTYEADELRTAVHEELLG